MKPQTARNNAMTLKPFIVWRNPATHNSTAVQTYDQKEVTMTSQAIALNPQAVNLQPKASSQEENTMKKSNRIYLLALAFAVLFTTLSQSAHAAGCPSIKAIGNFLADPDIAASFTISTVVNPNDT